MPNNSFLQITLFIFVGIKMSRDKMWNHTAKLKQAKGNKVYAHWKISEQPFSSRLIQPEIKARNRDQMCRFKKKKKMKQWTQCVFSIYHSDRPLYRNQTRMSFHLTRKWSYTVFTPHWQTTRYLTMVQYVTFGSRIASRPQVSIQTMYVCMTTKLRSVPLARPWSQPF